MGYRETARAKTPEQKRLIIEGIYAAWLKCPLLRLGQLIENARADETQQLFHVEDLDLATQIVEFATEHE